MVPGRVGSKFRSRVHASDVFRKNSAGVWVGAILEVKISLSCTRQRLCYAKKRSRVHASDDFGDLGKPLGVQDGSKMSQDGAKMSQDGAKIG